MIGAQGRNNNARIPIVGMLDQTAKDAIARWRASGIGAPTLPDNPSHRVTELLAAWHDGDKSALSDLMPLMYEQLRRLAERHLRRERPGHTLPPTALVHEAFLRLVDQKHVQWQNRSHFIGVASHLMRRILVDHARARRAAKRGGGLPDIGLDQTLTALELADFDRGADALNLLDALARAETNIDLPTIDDALHRLEQLDAQQARVVELRFFGGLTIVETAQVLDVSEATVKRDWAMARAWLRRELESSS